MIPLSTCKGKLYGVFGLARSGLASVASLRAGGASVVAWDDDDKKCEAARAAGAEIVPPTAWDWAKLAALVLSPGIPLTHPAPHAVVVQARTAGVEIIGDIELLMRELAAQRERPRVVAVTGTNGKSTTTALITHLLKTAGLSVQMGGNIGRAVLDLDPLPPAGVYVIEVSSFQIDLSPGLAPNVAVLLNITPDHIDRHGSLMGYAAVKRRIFQHLGQGGTAVIGVDDPHTAEICTAVSSGSAGRVVPISIGKALDRGVTVMDGVLFDRTAMPVAEVVDLRKARALPGRHNWQNAAAAYASARALSNDMPALVRGLLSFPGLPHRMEDVGAVGGVRFINDSKATNADAAAKALGCYETIYWIAGGVPKAGGIESLGEFFPRMVKAYLIGEAAAQFSATLKGEVATVMAGDLANAVELAAHDAAADGRPGAVVLLSPACASFDQFRDYEARGDRFRELVTARRAIAQKGPAAA